jgi:hypothetical protein
MMIGTKAKIQGIKVSCEMAKLGIGMDDCFEESGTAQRRAREITVTLIE